MRVFVASGIFHPESGGPATYLHKFLPDLVAQGHSATVLTFGDTSHQLTYPYPVTRIARVNYPVRQWHYYQAARRLWPGHDVAYVHSLNLPLPRGIRPAIGKIVGDPAWERAMNRGWVGPDTDIDAFQTAPYGLLAGLNKAWRAQVARRLDHVIVPSDYLRRMVIGWGVEPSHVTVIYNALEGTASPPRENREEARSVLGLPSGNIVLTPARLTVWKGIDHTLHALAKADNITLVVAGDGPARPVLAALAERLGVTNRVIFMGSVAREKMPLVYRAADYTLLYSGYEGLSHVLLESLNMGTPVIASHKGGNPEVVRHGINGLLVTYVDVQALTESLHEAFSPGIRGRLAENSQVSLTQFRWETLVQSTIDVLKAFS